MECPKCGYMLSPFDKECPRCARYADRGLPPPSGLKLPPDIDPEPVQEWPPAIHFCDICGAALKEEMRFCGTCGVATNPGERAVLAGIAPVAEPSPSPGWIALMWILTAVAWLIGISGAAGLGLLIDFFACLIAILMASSRSRTERTNGQVKLWLELAGFIIAFLIAAGNSSQNY